MFTWDRDCITLVEVWKFQQFWREGATRAHRYVLLEKQYIEILLYCGFLEFCLSTVTLLFKEFFTAIRLSFYLLSSCHMTYYLKIWSSRWHVAALWSLTCPEISQWRPGMELVLEHLMLGCDPYERERRKFTDAVVAEFAGKIMALLL